MGLMSINKSFAQTNVKADTLAKRKQYLVLQVGGGVSTYVSSINIQPIELPGSIQKTTGNATVRLMWYPHYRLRLGLESGFTSFYSYQVKNGNTPGKVSLNAIPILAVWSMQIVPRLNIYAGIGTYIVTTHLDYNGVVNSKAFVLGSNLALSYTQPVSKKIGIAAEAKWMNAIETKDASLCVQVHMVWKMLEWK
jgi:hypothetical protein